MKIDVDQQLRFPEAICISTQRPDIVIYSLKLKKVLLIELICPAEENIEERHSEKISHYDSLLKLVSAIFHQIFIFSPYDSPSKTEKGAFYFI